MRAQGTEADVLRGGIEDALETLIEGTNDGSMQDERAVITRAIEQLIACRDSADTMRSLRWRLVERMIGLGDSPSREDVIAAAQQVLAELMESEERCTS